MAHPAPVEADGSPAVAPGAEWRSALYGDTVTQFERAAEVLALDPEFHARCSSRAAP